jgi:hypothetical protein
MRSSAKATSKASLTTTTGLVRDDLARHGSDEPPPGQRRRPTLIAGASDRLATIGYSEAAAVASTASHSACQPAQISSTDISLASRW